MGGEKDESGMWEESQNGIEAIDWKVLQFVDQMGGGAVGVLVTVGLNFNEPNPVNANSTAIGRNMKPLIDMLFVRFGSI